MLQPGLTVYGKTKWDFNIAEREEIEAGLSWKF